MSKLAGLCIFCGKGDVTKEHLFSDWLGAIFTRTAQHTHTIGEIQRWAELNPQHTTRQRQGHSGTRKVRKVCRRCNSEWISAIDDRAKSVAMPFIFGDFAEVNATTQQTLATWLGKIAIVGDKANSVGSQISQSHRTWFREHQLLPAGWRVLIGSYVGQKWATLGLYQHGAQAHVPTPAGETLHGYVSSTMLGIGRLLGLVVATDIEGIGFNLGQIEEGMRQIWPRGPNFLWPTLPALNDTDADLVSTVLPRMVASPIRGDPNAG